MPKRELGRDYTFRGAVYQSGPSVEVPDGFEAGSPVGASLESESKQATSDSGQGKPKRKKKSENPSGGGGGDGGKA